MEEYKKTITNFRELSEAISYAGKKFDGQVWWRGQRNYNWDLRPKVFRDHMDKYNELSGMLRFQKKAVSRQENLPDQDDDPGWLFIMQHYGLPTRLLDWTEDPLTAAFFATEINECHKYHNQIRDDDGALFALSPYLLNETQTENHKAELLSSEHYPAKEIISNAFGRIKKEIKNIIAIRPHEVDMRLHAQLSEFVLFGSNESLENLFTKQDFIIKFRIRQSEKLVTREELKKYGIRLSKIFPDLDHLAEEIGSVRFKDHITKQFGSDKQNFKLDLNNNDFNTPYRNGETST